MANKQFDYWQDQSTGHIMQSRLEHGPDWVLLPKNEGKALFQEQSKKELLRYLKPGDTVLTVLRHVSASGMQRRIDLYTIKDGRLVYLSGYAENMGLAKRHDGKQGLIVNGCGMDMGYHLVYELASALFGDGSALKHEWV